MAYDEFLADRSRRFLADANIDFREMKMMGGLCFMINEKMCFGIMKNELMVRIHPEFYPQALEMKGCKPMDFTGRILKGFLLISSEGIDLEDDLDFWLKKCLEFNPFAKSSKG